MKDKLTAKSLLALMCADVDLKLLRDENENDLEKDSFTKEEIREQLEDSLLRLTQALREKGCNPNTPIINSFQYNLLQNTINNMR